MRENKNLAVILNSDSKKGFFGHIEKFFVFWVKGFIPILISALSLFKIVEYGIEIYDSYLMRCDDRNYRLEQQALEAFREKSEIQNKMDLNKFEIEKERIALKEKVSLIEIENERGQAKKEFLKSMQSNWNWTLITGSVILIGIGFGLYFSDDINLDSLTKLNEAVSNYFYESNKFNRDIFNDCRENVILTRRVLRIVGGEANLQRVRENLNIIDDSTPAENMNYE